MPPTLKIQTTGFFAIGHQTPILNFKSLDSFVPQPTEDGSLTFFSPAFNEHFHSHHGAKQEAESKFVLPCQLREKARENDTLTLLDLCYGLGYNSAAALEAIWQVKPHCRVELVGLEIDTSVPKAASSHHLLDSWRPPIPQLLGQLAEREFLTTSLLNACLLIADARQTLPQLCARGFQADAIFLDPFSPPKCPQLWTVEFLALVAKCLKPTGILATYSCAAAVRQALQLTGLQLGSTPAVGRRSPGTVACFQPEGLRPLSLREREALLTRAAVPYRDPHLSALSEEILRDRAIEQQNSALEPTAAWKKRWWPKNTARS